MRTRYTLIATRNFRNILPPSRQKGQINYYGESIIKYVARRMRKPEIGAKKLLRVAAEVRKEGGTVARLMRVFSCRHSCSVIALFVLPIIRQYRFFRDCLSQRLRGLMGLTSEIWTWVQAGWPLKCSLSRSPWNEAIWGCFK